MDLAKIQYFENVEKQIHREFIHNHNNCILCGSPLELQHIRNDDDGTIKEEARCESCDVRTRAKIYTLC